MKAIDLLQPLIYVKMPEYAYRYLVFCNRNIQAVRVMELSKVVRITLPRQPHRVRNPFAMTKLVTVVGDPHMIMAASAPSVESEPDRQRKKEYAQAGKLKNAAIPVI